MLAVFPKIMRSRAPLFFQEWGEGGMRRVDVGVSRSFRLSLQKLISWGHAVCKITARGFARSPEPFATAPPCQHATTFHVCRFFSRLGLVGSIMLVVRTIVRADRTPYRYPICIQQSNSEDVEWSRLVEPSGLQNECRLCLLHIRTGAWVGVKERGRSEEQKNAEART